MMVKNRDFYPGFVFVLEMGCKLDKILANII